MGCEIIPVKESGKIKKSSIISGAIHYLPNELKTRGFKTNDYEKLFYKLQSGEIQPGMKKWYSAKHLD